MSHHPLHHRRQAYYDAVYEYMHHILGDHYTPEEEKLINSSLEIRAHVEDSSYDHIMRLLEVTMKLEE